jgi:hypothetical protein
MHDPIAILMATASTRRGLTEAPREPRPRAPRRTVARVLLAAANRLDPYVARSPQQARRAAAG